MRAKLLAMTQLTPAALMHSGACSRDEPQPKLVVATMTSPGLHAAREVRVDVLHAVLRQLLRLVDVQVARRNDGVGIDVGAVLVNVSAQSHRSTSSGPASRPATALAAATAGFARYTSDRTCPIRPGKLRLLVLTQRSPSARMPM